MAFLQRTLEYFDQPIMVKRLFDKVVGTLAHGADGGADVALPRQDDHRNARIQRLNRLQHAQPIQAWHVIVAQDNASKLAVDTGQRAGTVSEAGDAEVLQ